MTPSPSLPPPCFVLMVMDLNLWYIEVYYHCCTSRRDTRALGIGLVLPSRLRDFEKQTTPPVEEVEQRQTTVVVDTIQRLACTAR